MDKKSIRDIAVSAAALALIAGGVTAALAGTNALTADTIAARNEEAETQARLQVIDADSFEKQTLTSADGEEVTYYAALQEGETVGYVFTVSATGKSAGLVVMTGISADGRITGVTVTDDNETAGYVDKVREGGLFGRFQDREAPDGGFTLGEEIDGVSQATKTSRGVTDGVNRAVAYYRQIKGAE
ncbi:MAG TPA: FMN-binding protein [Firmicutes bacterium]|nr:FMN-binding protein [Bacillota bacterium]